MKLAVVILNFNGEKLLRQFLPSVVKYSADAEVYVADNGSADRSVEVLEKEFPGVRVIKLDDNHGFCKGYNIALREVTADVYILLNSDVEVTQGWIDPIEYLLESNPEVDAVQPKILSYSEPDKFEYAGAGGGLIDRLGYPYCRGRVFDQVETDHGQYDDEREVFWSSGACMAIRARAYNELGGFDEDFFAHMEEIDLCWKINRTGRKVFYSGISTVYHLGAGTLNYNHPKKMYLNFRNNLYMLIKHLDTWELIAKLPARIVLDWVAAISFMIKGRPLNGFAVLKAHWYMLLKLGVTWRKRKSLRNAYPHYSRANVYPRVILFRRYFGSQES